MKELSSKAEELRQAIQDGIELEGITADTIAQTIIEVFSRQEIGSLLSTLLELAEWEAPS